MSLGAYSLGELAVSARLAATTLRHDEEFTVLSLNKTRHVKEGQARRAQREWPHYHWRSKLSTAIIAITEIFL